MALSALLETVISASAIRIVICHGDSCWTTARSKIPGGSRYECAEGRRVRGADLIVVDRHRVAVEVRYCDILGAISAIKISKRHGYGSVSSRVIGATSGMFHPRCRGRTEIVLVVLDPRQQGPRGRRHSGPWPQRQPAKNRQEAGSTSASERCRRHFPGRWRLSCRPGWRPPDRGIRSRCCRGSLRRDH